MELEKVKAAVNTEAVAADLKTRKAVQLIVDNAKGVSKSAAKKKTTKKTEE